MRTEGRAAAVIVPLAAFAALAMSAAMTFPPLPQYALSAASRTIAHAFSADSGDGDAMVMTVSWTAGRLKRHIGLSGAYPESGRKKRLGAAML
jgi:hypothetical protein